MIQSITAFNTVGDSLRLELGKPEKSGYLIESIDGLGPEKADISSTNNALGDGAFFNSAKKSTKQITLNLKFLWMKDKTIEELRLATYKYFPVKKEVRLLVETDERISIIDTYVESNEPDIFSQESGTVITLMAMFPYFKSSNYIENKFTGIEALFEFPFCNDDLYNPLLEMGNYRNKTTRNILYNGDHDIGINIVIEFSGNSGDIGIYNVTSNTAMFISISKIKKRINDEIKKDDKIVICTELGNKSAKLYRGDKEFNILNAISKDSNWLTLRTGDNMFAYTAKEKVENISEFKIENSVLYEGV